MPTTMLGSAGEVDLILPDVFTSSPPMTRLYSRPSSARTRASASFIARRFSSRVKSVSGSFLNAPCGSAVRMLGASTVAMGGLLGTVHCNNFYEGYGVRECRIYGGRDGACPGLYC